MSASLQTWLVTDTSPSCLDMVIYYSKTHTHISVTKMLTLWLTDVIVMSQWLSY